MQADDLASLSYQLYQILPYNSEMRRVICSIAEALAYASDKKIDKDGERRVKEMLYRIDILFHEFEHFTDNLPRFSQVSRSLLQEVADGEEGKYSKLIGKELRSLIASQMKLILKELKPYSENYKSLITKETMVGTDFHHQKEQLIALLLDSNSSPRVIILGKPGTGKSTLTWDALLDSRVQKYFYNIFSGLFQSDLSRHEWNGKNKSLTVVDDRSDVNEIRSLLSVDEETLLSLKFFQSNAKGSKIVILSSLQLEIEHIAASKVRLPSLDDDESWILFQNIAFRDRERPHSTLVDIGRKIFQMCENIPGVINTVASILSSKSTSEWEYFLNVVLTSVPDPITTISSIFEFTNVLYDNKRYWRHCFVWCSLLPKDYVFQKDRLFHLWRAQEDFAEADEHFKRDVEMQLDPCFNEFLRKGYFLEGDTVGSSVSYKINHLAFELMKYVGGDDFCLVDKTTPEPNHKIIRHASFIVDPSWQPPSWLPNAKQLQSLLLWPRNPGEFISLSKIGTILSRMTHLRTLHAEAIHCERLPGFLVEFKKLAYLRFGVVSSVSLPEDIPALLKLLICDFRYNSIQKFALNGKDTLLDENLEQQKQLPLLIKFAGFKNLIIQYEKFFEQTFLEQTHKVIRSLNLQSDDREQTFLNPRQNLERLKARHLKEESPPSGVVDELSIEQTHKIIGSLNLQSTSFSKDDWEQTFLDPHQTVESLKVRCWKEESIPSWVTDELSVFLNSLLTIQIASCDKCKHLPGFNTLPHLSSLQVGGMRSLVDITISCQNAEFSSKKAFYPSLKCLLLCDLPELEGWSSKEADNNQHIQERYFFPLLNIFRVQGCPKLISMPLMPKLESLEAINMNTKIVHEIVCSPLIAALASEGIQDLTQTSEKDLLLVRNLKISDCNESDWGDKHNTIEKGVWHALRCLRSLTVSNAPQLVSLPRGIEQTKMLEQLSLSWLTNLKVLPEWIGLFNQLRQLTIHYCLKLTMLPNSDGCFSTLEQLEIRYCPRLSQFPKSLPNLKRLRVQEFCRLEQVIRVSQNLEELEINNCDELEWETSSVEGDASINVWERLNCLHLLKLTKMDAFPKGLDFAKLSKLSRIVIEKCPKLANLPESICSVSTLEHLQIHYCPGMINLPRNFNNLGSLKKLEIRVSPELEKRCKPDSEDWSLIQHIPNIVINDLPQQNGAEQQSVA